MTTVVLSPHFDDAVLSCARWLEQHPGTIVATVCSGKPGPGVPADPAWDALARFSSGDHAAESRRDEDLDALGVLGAEQLVLGFLDGSFYKERAGRWHEAGNAGNSFEAHLTRSIDEVLDDLDPDACLLPLGLLHPDHIVTRRAALISLRGRPQVRSMVYLDLPYGIAFEAAALEQIEELAGAGLDLVAAAVPVAVSANLKRRAASCYRSQLPLLEVAFGAELHRSLDPGAERLFHSRHCL